MPFRDQCAPFAANMFRCLSLFAVRTLYRMDQSGLFEAMDSVGFSEAAQCQENPSLVLFDFEFNASNVAPLAPARTAAGASNRKTQPAQTNCITPSYVIHFGSDMTQLKKTIVVLFPTFSYHQDQEGCGPCGRDFFAVQPMEWSRLLGHPISSQRSWQENSSALAEQPPYQNNLMKTYENI